MLKKIKFPDPIILLMSFIVIAMIATHIVQAGAFERVLDEVSGRQVIVSNSYAITSSSPVGFFDMLVAIPKGMQQAASVIFFVFLVGGSFVVINNTGALKSLVEYVVSKLNGKEIWGISICIFMFASLGAVQNFQEEIIPLVPVLLLLCARLGFDNLTAVAISIGAAFVGAAFSPINPFQVGIAQKIADVELLSGAIFRSGVLVIAVLIYNFMVFRYVKKTRKIPQTIEATHKVYFSKAHKVILLLLGLTFIVPVIGVSQWNWDFEQMTALFFLTGILSGIIGGLKTSGTINSFIEGFKDMVYAGLLIGLARAIYVVLEEGYIVDSIVNSMFTPISQLPTEISLTGITLMQSVMHFPVPSVSGQAVLTIPLLAPLADLMGVSRQLIILCYQYGAGITELIIPTNGALMAILVACKVPFGKWLKFSIKAYTVLIILGILSIYIAQLIGFS